MPTAQDIKIKSDELVDFLKQNEPLSPTFEAIKLNQEVVSSLLQIQIDLDNGTTPTSTFDVVQNP